MKTWGGPHQSLRSEEKIIGECERQKSMGTASLCFLALSPFTLTSSPPFSITLFISIAVLSFFFFSFIFICLSQIFFNAFLSFLFHSFSALPYYLVSLPSKIQVTKAGSTSCSAILAYAKVKCVVPRSPESSLETRFYWIKFRQQPL